MGIGIIMVLVALLAVTANAQQPSIKVVGVHYNPLDWNEHPIAVGLLTWCDDDYDHELGIYGQMAFISFKDAVRLNAGFGAIWESAKDRPKFRPVTSLTFGVPVGGGLVEIGAYYAPFWGLDERSDDPWGFMLGYAF